jgi:hypothetical protein
MASSRQMAAPGRRPAQEGSDRAAELRWSMASRCTPRRRRRRISGGAPRRTRRRGESMPPPASLPSLPSVPSIRAKGGVVVARRDGRRSSSSRIALDLAMRQPNGTIASAVPSPGAAGKTGNEAPICHRVPARSIYSHRCGQSKTTIHPVTPLWQGHSKTTTHPATQMY